MTGAGGLMRAWCGPHRCHPHDCFFIHYPWAFRDHVSLPAISQVLNGLWGY